MSLDVDKVRADTPACAEIVHLNNCGASLPPTPVVDAMFDYLRFEASAGGYEAVEDRAADLERVYGAGSRVLGCRPDELAFVSGSAEAWWRAFLSVPLVAGDRVLLGRTEYIANGLALMQAAERGVLVEIVPDDSTGQIDLEALEAMLDERVKAVCLTMVAMANGLVNPAAEVGRLVKQVGAYFIVDACQAVGQLPVNVDDLSCDFLSFTGRKFVRGPRGTGMLYVRSSVMPHLEAPTFIDGRSAKWLPDMTYELKPTAQRFELAEIPYGAKVGLGVALDYAHQLGLDAIETRIGDLARHARTELKNRGGVSVTDTGVRQCGIVTFTVEGHAPAEVVAHLRRADINTGNPGAVASRLDLEGRGVEEVVRLGIHYYNTLDELDRFLAELDMLTA